MAYDPEWTARRGLPAGSQLRFGLTTHEGVPVRFLVQLEYRDDEQWLPVARFDHDAFGSAYRNVERVGWHLDRYHPDGHQIEKRMAWSPQPADAAMGVAEEYLRDRSGQLIARFESWL